MKKIYNDKDEEFIYTESFNEDYTRFINAYFFATAVPMNMIWASEKNKIMVNGRKRPFARVLFDKRNNIYLFNWVILFPIYSINEQERNIIVDFELLAKINIPPIPKECWSYYKSYYKKFLSDKYAS